MELHIENLCKAFDGRPVLEHVTFTAGTGVTCVMAPSGAGKTTLLRILLGLERPDSGNFTGNVRWAAVFQEDRLLEHLDAMGNLRFVLGAALDETAAGALLTELGLGDTAGKPVREFSGGMKRRLALDEPFTGLDEENRARCLALLRRAGEEKPVLLVTHDPADAQALDAAVVKL